MSRSFTLTLAAAVLALVTYTTPVAAQCSGTSVSQSCNVTAQVVVQATLSCVVNRNFDFGSHPSAIGVVGSDENNHGRITCTTDPGNLVNVSFTLPASLSDGAGHTVPLTYGNEAGRLYDGTGGGAFTAFNPAVGFVGFTVGSGTMTLALGENGANQTFSEVSVNLSSAAAGTYTTGASPIVATIALQ